MPYDLNDPAYPRVKARPLPEMWDPREPITLAEVPPLLFPEGPVRLHTLRQEVKRGNLPVKMLANRYYTTIADVREMMRTAPLPPPPESVGPPPGLVPPARARRTPEQDALDAALSRLGSAPRRSGPGRK